MLNKEEFVVALKILGIVFFILVLYLASQVLGESYSVFDYGRF